MKVLWGLDAIVRRTGLLILLGSFTWSAQARASTSPQILYFEPLRVTLPESEAARQKTSARTLKQIELTAYGRHYALSVEAQSAHGYEKQAASSLHLYRGSIDGVASSWVRLGTQGTDVHGMLWDGDQLYIIAPASEVRDQLLPPLDAASGSVIFRLADALVPSEHSACATGGAAPMLRASDAYEAVLKETGQGDLDEALAGSMHLEVSTIADARFLERYGSAEEARAGVLLRMNNVDGIFGSQLGVQIKVSTVEIHDASTDPFSAASSPNTLLEELAALRRRSTQLRSSGLTHLFTGRDLEGSTIGIGYLDALCDTRYGAALTEVGQRGTWYESLIAAHEIGHNFGAVHDGESGKACASTPQGLFLMSPNVNAVDRFSECSQELMRPKIASATCVTALPPADVSVRADLGVVRRDKGSAFTWDLPIANVGGTSALNVLAQVRLPQGFIAEEAWVEGGSCTHGAGVVQCELAPLPAGSTQSVEVRLRSDAIGSNSISALVSARNEQQTNNNEGLGIIQIDAQAPPTPSGAPSAATPTASPTSSASSASGGGGAMGSMLLVALSLLGCLRRTRV
jgi:hypothetical protein